MGSIHFFTPVSYGPFVHSVSEKLLEFTDDLFSWSGKKVQVMPGNKIRNSAGVIEYFEDPSLLRNVIKVAAYCTLLISMSAVYAKKTPLRIGGSCALALPLIAFVVKLVLRTIHKFHYIERCPVKFVGEIFQASRPIFITRGELNFDTAYRMSFDLMTKLGIVPIDKRINHNLPQRSNDVYAIPPHICTCQSSIFNDSIFEVDYKYVRSAEVVRRKSQVGEDELMSFDETYQLSTNAIIDLKIVPVGPSSGYSLRPEYRDSEFSFVMGATSWNVTRSLCIRNYAYLPFNEAVTYEPGRYGKLMFLSDNHSLEPGVKWTVYTSDLPEYAKSVILVKEAGHPGALCVRMLQPEFASK